MSELPQQPRPITVLSDHVIDQIAAGEVVERPASVVKELVENALDAGATRIDIDIEDGGKKKIRVLDDGIGMTQSQAMLALKRHATSKLVMAEELFGISTMGFRGEALPSIASVSSLTITTRTADSPSACQLKVDGGTLVSCNDFAAAKGTAIEVLDLFANVPVRRKFLKNKTTEATQINTIVSRLAMAHIDVGFCLRSAKRTLIHMPPHQHRMDRVIALLGMKFDEQLYAYEATESDVSVQVYVASPKMAQSTSRGIQLFVSNRPVRDKDLLHAVLMGYGELIPQGRYPTAIVFIEVPPQEVDINVHPQKSEVRFTQSRSVHAAVRHTISRALAQTSWINDSDIYRKPSVGHTELFAPQYNPTNSMRSVSRVTEPRDNKTETLREDRQQYSVNTDEASRSIKTMSDRSHSISSVQSNQSNQSKKLTQISSMMYLATLANAYAVYQCDQGLVLVDQKAVMSHMMKRQLKKEWLDKRVIRQQLLFPLHMTLSQEEIDNAAVLKEMLNAVGIVFTLVSDNEYMINEVPSIAASTNIEQLCRMVLKQPVDIDVLCETIVTYSCDNLDDSALPEDIESLFDERMDGKPLMSLISHEEIYTRFF